MMMNNGGMMNPMMMNNGRMMNNAGMMNPMMINNDGMMNPMMMNDAGMMNPFMMNNNDGMENKKVYLLIGKFGEDNYEPIKSIKMTILILLEKNYFLA